MPISLDLLHQVQHSAWHTVSTQELFPDELIYCRLVEEKTATVMGSRKLSQRSSLGLRELHLKTKHCLDSCEVWGNRSIEFKAVIKSSKSALLEKMQTGFGVKRLSQTLSSSTDNLVLAFRLFWGCTLPVHILCVFRAGSLRGVPCLSPAAPVSPGWLPASSLHILENMRGPCIGKAVCLSA